MLTNDKVDRITRMITEECSRFSLAELCEYWEVTIEEFETFLRYAGNYASLVS